ncbi:uncharacterized protein BX663DRAFT_503072 [Cokeromyces recurvatus]|uniref:uncharacterized protein n=1 Tax=Cokeromyces recurvatus TaxID=90255 RepID=UPI00221EA9B6|nr:uncharacterized protein BX663DRAFT_503072 [Cokeromyces recurvatus]KAI7904644.1 hypothetical protein BX663DRAFT_503072 [Cokeromyces recurvatus]
MMVSSIIFKFLLLLLLLLIPFISDRDLSNVGYGSFRNSTRYLGKDCILLCIIMSVYTSEYTLFKYRFDES